MTTKFEGATPGELFAEAFKRTVEQAMEPVLERMAELFKEDAAAGNGNTHGDAQSRRVSSDGACSTRMSSRNSMVARSRAS